MSAKMFFSLLDEGRRTQIISKNLFLLNLCDVASCAQADSKWINELKQYFRSNVSEVTKEKDHQITTHRTKEEITLAASSLMEALRMKSRIEGYG